MCNYKFVTPFDSAIREQIAQLVVEELRPILPNIRVDPSWESGFNLPLIGTKWATKDYGEHLNSIIKYHGSRQLRFSFDNFDNKVIGLRFKDGIVYWSDQEVQALLDCVNRVIQKIDK